MSNIVRYWDKQAIKRKKLLPLKRERFQKCYSLISYYLDKNNDIADLGCGTGHITFQLHDKVKSIHAIDFSEAMISIAKAQKRSGIHDNILFEIGNIEQTSLEEKTKDAALLCNMLHCVENGDLILKEAKRIVKANGVIITSSYCYMHICSIRSITKLLAVIFKKIFNNTAIIHLMTHKQLRQKLENSGMIIIAEKKIKIRGVSLLFSVLKT